MSIAKPVIYDNGMQRVLAIGDVMALADSVPAVDVTNTNLTITGAKLLAKYILRNPAGVSNENIDTAANIINAITTQFGGNVPNGTTWIVRWINISANILTLVGAANTGVTVNRPLVNAAVAGSNIGMKDYLVTIVNGSPAQTVSATTVNGSAVIAGLTPQQTGSGAALVNQQPLTVGMVVTNAVAGLQGATIIGINTTAGGASGAQTVTLSAPANATNATPVAITFSPVVQLDGLAP